MIKIFTLTLFPCLLATLLAAQTQFLVGYGKSDLTYTEESLGLFGFGDYHQRTDTSAAFSSRIYSRVVSIKEQETGKQIIYLHADLGAIFHPLRTGLLKKIKENLYPDFDEAYLMMTASHTHCAPSGMSHYALYMASFPGYNPALVEFMVERMYESVVQSIETQRLSRIEIKEGTFAPDIPVAFNRALKAYNRNKDIPTKYKQEETHLALNRNMPLMSFVHEDGSAGGFINWFGVHPIEVGPDHNQLDGASKGYAAEYAEAAMPPNTVAIFAQGAAGDVMTADFHNVADFESQMQGILADSSYNHLVTNLQHAKWNGQQQAKKSLAIQNSPKNLNVTGGLDAELIYIDMSEIQVDPAFSNGVKGARTSSPILGAAFFSGLFYWKDMNIRRRGLNFFANCSKLVYGLRAPFLKKEKRQYRRELYNCHAPKKLVLNGEEKSAVGVKFDNCHEKGISRYFLRKMANVDITIAEVVREIEDGAMEEHSILPKIVPIQLIRIGNIAIAGIPTEITTVAHNRLQATLLETLKQDGIQQVFISSYANEYAGYTTTYQEYKLQRYEGGHTLFGKHQLGAFQTEFQRLAQAMLLPKAERELNRDLQPPVFSEAELEKRSYLVPLEEGER